jgi:hypothetical protein
MLPTGVWRLSGRAASHELPSLLTGGRRPISYFLADASTHGAAYQTTRRSRPAPLLASAHVATAHIQARGKKTKTTIKLEDLPQGPIQADPLPIEDDGPAYPTVVLQARRNMKKFDNCVLLTRVGGFYELYFEQAEEYGPLLNLKVAQKKTSAGPVPMVV